MSVRLGIAVAIALLSGAFLSESAIAAKPGPETAQPSEAAPSGPVIPSSEQQFLRVIADARKDYNTAKTTKARQDIRQSMQIKLHEALMISQDVKDWVGRIKNLDFDLQGTATVTFEIGDGIYIETWQDHAFDAQYGTLIPAHTKLNQALRNLQLGDIAVFSASLIGTRISADDDMISQPHTIARFTEIKAAN